MQTPYSPTAQASQALFQGPQQTQATVIRQQIVRQKPAVQQAHTSMSGTQASVPQPQHLSVLQSQSLPTMQSSSIPSGKSQPTGLIPGVNQPSPNTASSGAVTSLPLTSGKASQIQLNNPLMNDSGKEAKEKAGDQAGEEIRNRNRNMIDISADNGNGKCLTDSAVKRLPYTADQWAPHNPDGKKQYGRDFLLQLQMDPLSLKKLEAMPTGIEIVKDKVNKRVLLQNTSAPNMSDFTQNSNKSLQSNKSNKLADITSDQVRTSESNKLSKNNCLPISVEGPSMTPQRMCVQLL